MPKNSSTGYSNKGLLTRMTGLWVAGMVIGCAVNVIRPDGLPWVYPWSASVEAKAFAEGIPLISVGDVREGLSSGNMLALDARPEAEYRSGHLPGALSTPVEDFDAVFPEIRLFLFPGQPVAVYCSGPHCEEALRLALYLRDQGIEDVVLFPGGVEEWVAAGWPLEGGRW